jgi:hypothetical protein
VLHDREASSKHPVSSNNLAVRKTNIQESTNIHPQGMEVADTQAMQEEVAEHTLQAVAGHHRHIRCPDHYPHNHLHYLLEVNCTEEPERTPVTLNSAARSSVVREQKLGFPL